MFVNLCLLQNELRALNRYETCIEQIRLIMEFPLEVMFQLKYANRVNKTSLKEFIQKTLLIDKIKDSIMNTPIYFGFPDELKTPKFLNKLYANLNLTGEEGVYKMYQEIKKYEKLLKYGNNSIYLENLSENAKIIFEECREYDQDGTFTCTGQNNILIKYLKYYLFSI